MREERRKITTITTARTSSAYGASNNRSVLGYWVPLAITVTAASIAIGAWIWSERSDEEESESDAEHYYANASGARPGSTHGGGLTGAAAAAGAAGLGAAAGYSSMSGGLPPGPGPTGSQQPPPGSYAPQPPIHGGFQGPPPGSLPPPQGGEAASFYRQENQSRGLSTGVTTDYQEDTGLLARMSNAVGLTRGETPGRTNFSGGGWASRSLAAAGSMVEGAVNAVRGSTEEGNQHFSDQEKWSEEADKPERTNSMSPRKSGASIAAGAALGAVAGAVAADAVSEPRSMGIARSGTAAEFYSGAFDAPKRSSVVAQKRRTVAIAVSAVDSPTDQMDVDAHQSILAQLPEYVNQDTTRIIVLIYDAELHTHPLSLISRRASERQASAPSARSISTSSYARINTPGANGTPMQTPGDFPQDDLNEGSPDKGILAHVDPQPIQSHNSPNPTPAEMEAARASQSSFSQPPPDYRLPDAADSQSRQGSTAVPPPMNRASSNEMIPANNPLDTEANPLFKTLYNQANALVDRDTSVLPFTTRDGHKHILRSIQPEILYIQESLCGADGSLVSELSGWVRSIVVVIGDEGGLGGLVDSDTEEEETGAQKRAESMANADTWWKRESVTGVGRGVSVVESLRVGEDWRRRVNDEE